MAVFMAFVAGFTLFHLLAGELITQQERVNLNVVNSKRITQVKTNKSEAQLASDNVKQNGNLVRCQLPKPKVVPVQKVHPHASKRFVPSCVILHRCGRDTGCCDDQTTTCSFSRRQRIKLYFYVVTFDASGGQSKVISDGQVEALTFVNHTECACRQRKRAVHSPHSKESTLSASKDANFNWWLVFLNGFLVRYSIR